MHESDGFVRGGHNDDKDLAEIKSQRRRWRLSRRPVGHRRLCVRRRARSCLSQWTTARRPEPQTGVARAHAAREFAAALRPERPQLTEAFLVVGLNIFLDLPRGQGRDDEQPVGGLRLAHEPSTFA